MEWDSAKYDYLHFAGELFASTAASGRSTVKWFRN